MVIRIPQRKASVRKEVFGNQLKVLSQSQSLG